MVAILKTEAFQDLGPRNLLMVIVNRKGLKKSLATLKRVADIKSTMPALSCVNLTAANERLTLTTTSLNMWATCEVNLHNATIGSCALEVKQLADIVGKLTSDEVSISADALWCHVRADQADITLEAKLSRDMPHRPKSDDVAFATIEASDLVTLIKRVEYAVCKDEARFHLNGVFFEMNGAKLRAVATDGHRLALANMPIDVSRTHIPTRGIIVPTKGTSELVKTLTKGACEIGFDAGKMLLFVRQGAWEFAIKVIDAQFPPYAQVIPERSATKTSVTFKIADMGPALDRATVQLGKQSTRGVSIKRSYGEGGVTLEVSGSSSEFVSASPGDPFVVGANPKYLSEALEAIQSTGVWANLHYSETLNPILLTSDNDGLDTRVLAVVMPMRL